MARMSPKIRAKNQNVIPALLKFFGSRLMNLIVVRTAILSKILFMMSRGVPVESEGNSLKGLEDFAEIVSALGIQYFDEGLEFVECLGQSEQFARLLHTL